MNSFPFPPIEDDGQKPNHSYATLIAMAIIRSPLRRLTLSQIYKWISDSFAYYRGDHTGWQNGIRHNLSLNKSFVKQERPRTIRARGAYWAIGGHRHIVLKAVEEGRGRTQDARVVEIGYEKQQLSRPSGFDLRGSIPIIRAPCRSRGRN